MPFKVRTKMERKVEPACRQANVNKLRKITY